MYGREGMGTNPNPIRLLSFNLRLNLPAAQRKGLRNARRQQRDLQHTKNVSIPESASLHLSRTSDVHSREFGIEIGRSTRWITWSPFGYAFSLCPYYLFTGQAANVVADKRWVGSLGHRGARTPSYVVLRYKFRPSLDTFLPLVQGAHAPQQSTRQISHSRLCRAQRIHSWYRQGNHS